jgi:hypothetical protein
MSKHARLSVSFLVLENMTVKMIDRRLLLQGTLSTVAAVAAVHARPILRHAGRPADGCCLCAGVAGERFRGLIQAVPGRLDIIRSSGDAETDKFLGAGLARLATTFKVSPGFAFFEDGDTPNAFATADDILKEGAGTVLMGKRLFARHMADDKDGGMSIMAICAHEFAHIHQMATGLEARLKVLDSTAKPVELHADFLAGYFLALRKRDHAELDLSAIGRVFYDVGDNAFKSRRHHGTSEERVTAITAGFAFGKTGAPTIEAASKAGLLYLIGNGGGTALR